MTDDDRALVVAACDAMSDLEGLAIEISNAISARDSDRIRRILAGPIAVVARSTLQRLYPRPVDMVPR